MSTVMLPRATSESQGVDSDGVFAFLDRMAAAPDIELHSLMIVRHGHVVAEGWWAPYTADQPHLLYSLSKSFTSTAVGFAVGEGLVDLDATVLSYFPEMDAGIPDPHSRAMLVRHVAAMASGHLDETYDGARDLDGDDLLRGFLRIPPDREPGSVFAYNQPCTYALARIVQRQSGNTLREYLRPRLFEPLGIDHHGWQTDDAGREIGYSGMYATTESIAKLGLLYLQEGRWNGQQLISSEWVAEATTPQVANLGMGNPDWEQGYGFQFWIARHGYRGDGAYGQFCVVLPDHDVVIAITAATENMQGILDAAWATLLPAFGHTSVPTTAGDTLAARMGGLALAPVDATSEPGTEVGSEVTFAPAGGLCAGQPSLAAVAISRSEDGWIITLYDGADRLAFAVGAGEWADNLDEADGGRAAVPIAVSGGWTDSQTFLADVIFLQTPHRLAVSCRVSDRTFTASWRTAPLGSTPLIDLRMPR